MRQALVVLLACGVCPSAAIVGDQLPPPYPILDIHVPEPKAGSLEKKWAADENQRSALQLEEIEERLKVSTDALWSSSAALAAKIEQTAALAEDAMNAVSGNIALKRSFVAHGTQRP